MDYQYLERGKATARKIGRKRRRERGKGGKS
jgi:hypothetical protein